MRLFPVISQLSSGQLRNFNIGMFMLLAFVGVETTYADVPYIFQPNTTSKSSEVNENFRVLDEAIKNIKASDTPNQVREKFFSGTECKGATPDDVMVKVGPLCVDKYEASVWSDSAGKGIQYGAKAGAETATTRPGDDYPCDDNGNNCSGSASTAHPIFALSKKNVIPSRYATWFQAQQACANSGKRLLTNAEWQMAAAGTPDTVKISPSDFQNLAATDAKARAAPWNYGDDAANGDCSTVTSLGASALGSPTVPFNLGEVLPVPTGSRSKCISNWGVNDMIGNVWEWVADWTQGSPAPATPPDVHSNEAYAYDYMASVSPAANQGTGLNMPAAIYRGSNGRDWLRSGVFAFAAGRAPSDSTDDIGFRCAK